MMLSVIIPAYNRASVLPKAIKSVFEQGIGDLEIIVVDDASRDTTQDVIAAMNDPRIVYVRHPRNMGGAAARNSGIAKAQGEYIAFLDSDDLWLPGKLRKQMDLFKKLDDSYGVVYTGLKVVFEEEDRDPPRSEIVEAVYRGSFLNELLIANCIRTLSSVVVKRRYLEAVGGLDPQLRSCQDWDLYIRLMKECKFECVNEPLVIYHVNKADPSRISNTRKSIVQGHDLIARKYKDDYKKLARRDRVRYLESVSEMFSLGGSLSYPVGMMTQAFFLTGSFKYLYKGLRYFARYFKRRMEKRYGY
jgi:glycosyltransferase involved in cell wall biosynthesis